MLPEDRNEPAGEDGNRSILCPPSPDALLWGPEATSRGRMGKPSSEGHRLVSEGEVRPQPGHPTLGLHAVSAVPVPHQGMWRGVIEEVVGFETP